jgi:predicted Zn-dependent protease
MIKRKLYLKWVTLISSLFLISCITIYNPATQKKEIYFITDKMEIMIGKNIANDILRKNKIIKDEKLTSYVNNVGKKIASVSDRNYLDYKFYILDNKEINAFALPGGFVFVNKGLMEKVDKEELAFVLGHEIGHICARHSIKRLQASLGISIILSLALKKPDYELIRRAIDIVYEVISLGYSRKDELLADSLGVKYMIKAGFNPQKAISLLKKLQKKENNKFALYFLRSHPPIEERIKNIQNQILIFSSSSAP